jgi:hypothetical protein
MDENAKARFKWKFYRLTVELNGIVLLVALSVAGFFIIHSPYMVPVIIGMLVLVLILSLDFIRKYRETKAWLDDNVKKENDIRKKPNCNPSERR